MLAGFLPMFRCSTTAFSDVKDENLNSLMMESAPCL